MEQYIPKDALLAELKKRFDYRVNGLKAINNNTFWDKDQSEDEFNAVLTRCAYNAAKNEVFELICFLDTLEVKEVDLDGISRHYALNNSPWDDCRDEIQDAYKAGFELRLKAQKGE